jgi:hypothetical protein
LKFLDCEDKFGVRKFVVCFIMSVHCMFMYDYPD